MKEGNDEVDQRLEKIADLHKGKKIDFETIEKIADALKAKGHEVNPRYVQQFLSQHGVGMNEYGYADQYPGAWPFREEEMEEGLHMPPLQATGPTIDTVEENSTSNAPFGFDVLSPDERKQLKEYIESIKTIKKEIAKLTSKAGKKVKEGDLGGNRTDLVMTPSVTSEADSHDKIEQIEEKIPEKLYSASVRIVEELKKAGLTDGEIELFLKHEIEEKAKEAIMGQHD